MDEFFDKLLKELECILKTAVAERMDDGFLPQYSNIFNQVIDVRNEKRIPHLLPSGPCIYIYTFFADGSAYPNAIYIGQTIRDVYSRFHEHLRSKRIKSGIRIQQLSNSSVLHMFCLPVPATEYLNDLEAAGGHWIKENVIYIEQVNGVEPGHSNSAEKCTRERRAKICLPRITDLGDRRYTLSLKSVAQDLDDLESQMTNDELKDIDDLAKVISSNEDIRKEVQACQSVAIDTTGEVHILTGDKILLAARRAGREEAFGNVTVTYSMPTSRNRDGLVKQEILFVRELRNNLPERQFNKLADIGKEKFLRKYPENKRDGTHYVKLEGVADLIATNCPSKSSVKKWLKIYECY